MNSVRDDIDTQASIARAFSRFYVRRIGLLDGGLLKGSFSLTQMHVLYELAYGGELTASDLQRELGLDKGYLSRILKKFADEELIVRHRSPDDGRRSIIVLTKKGQQVFKPLDRSTQERNIKMLAKLPNHDRMRVITAMQTIRALLGDRQETIKGVTLRRLVSGDIGWITYRHGVLYRDEFGWDETFEAMVATILGDFASRDQNQDEQSWIAEIDGEVVGSIFCMRQSKRVAQLRVFYVEPEVRSIGVGSRLINECIQFARDRGYHSIVLRTSESLSAAGRLYEAHGFTLSKQRHVERFGRDIVDQDWTLKL